MKGISRKIDELGRIVIPKEIRNNLNINVNDELEIYVNDNKIIFEKYSKLDNIKDFIKNLIKNIKDVNEMKILVTDKEKVIDTNELITKDLKNIIENNVNKKNINLNITDKLETNCSINIIKENYLPIGSVVIVGNNLNELDCKLGNFIAQILSNYIAL